MLDATLAKCTFSWFLAVDFVTCCRFSLASSCAGAALQHLYLRAYAGPDASISLPCNSCRVLTSCTYTGAQGPADLVRHFNFRTCTWHTWRILMLNFNIVHPLIDLVFMLPFNIFSLHTRKRASTFEFSLVCFADTLQRCSCAFSPAFSCRASTSHTCTHANLRTWLCTLVFRCFPLSLRFNTPVSSMKPLEKSKRKRKGWKERLGRKRLKGNDRLAAFMNIRRTNFSRFCLLGRAGSKRSVRNGGAQVECACARAGVEKWTYKGAGECANLRVGYSSEHASARAECAGQRVTAHF